MGNAAQLATSAVDKLMSGFHPATLRQDVVGFHSFPSGSWAASLSGECPYVIGLFRVFKS